MRKPIDIGKVLLIGLLVVAVIAVVVIFDMFSHVKYDEDKPVDNLVSDSKSDHWGDKRPNKGEEEDEEALSEEVISEDVVSEEVIIEEDLPPEVAEFQTGEEFVNVSWDILEDVYVYFDSAPSFKSTDEVKLSTVLDALFWCQNDFRDGKYKLQPFNGDSVAIHHAIQDPFRDPDDKDFRYVAGPNFDYKISVEELNGFSREYFGQKVKNVSGADIANKIYGSSFNLRCADLKVYYYNDNFYISAKNKAKNSENRYFIASANDAGKKIDLIVFYVKPKLNPEDEGKTHIELQDVYKHSMIDGYIRKKITLSQGYNNNWYITSSRTMSKYKM